MKKLNFIKMAIAILINVILMGSYVSAQTGLNYLEHRTFSTDEIGNIENLIAVRNPFTDQLISRFLFSVYSPNTVDLSLGNNPEPFTMEPTQEGADDHYAIFKLLNGDDLSEEFSFAVSSTNIQMGEVGFQFGPNFYAIEYRLDTSATLYAGPNQIIQNTSNDNYLTCLLGFNMDGTLHTKRLISHRSALLSHSITNRKDKFFGIMNEDVQCADFSFRDSIEITENGVATQMYSADLGTYLDVRYANGDGYAGILDYTGKLMRRDAIVIGSNVYRVFEVSGSADLDPTATVSNYTTPDDETHLVIASYNALGNVEWAKLLASNYCEVSDAGKFYCTLLNDGGKLILDYFYARNYSYPDISSTSYVYNDGQILESGELIPYGNNGVYKNSPGYVSILNSDTGDAIQIYSTNTINSESSGFAQSRRGEKRVSIVEPGKIVIELKSTNTLFADAFVFSVKSLFPDTLVYETQLEPSTTSLSELYVFSTAAAILEDQFTLAYENVTDYGFIEYDSFAFLNNERIIISGSVRGSNELLFSNVPPVAVAAFPDPYWDGDGIAIYAKKTPLQVKNRSESLFKLYPNPASTLLSIESNLGHAKFKIFNQVGKIIQSGSLRNASEHIDITSLASGMYLIQIESKDGFTEGQKFVKQ